MQQMKMKFDLKGSFLVFENKMLYLCCQKVSPNMLLFVLEIVL